MAYFIFFIPVFLYAEIDSANNKRESTVLLTYIIASTVLTMAISRRNDPK